MISLKKDSWTFRFPAWAYGNVFVTLMVVIGVIYNISIHGPIKQSFKVVDKVQGMSSTNSKPVFGTYIKYSGNVNHVIHYEFIENPIIAKDIDIGESYWVEQNGIGIIAGVPWAMLIVGFIFGNLVFLFFGNMDDV